MGQTALHRHQLKMIFEAGLARVDPYRMLMERVRIAEDKLLVDVDDHRETLDLNDFKRIVVIGAGKATAAMAAAMEAILGDRIDEGLIAVKYGHTAPLSRIRIQESGHPVPDENGVDAARQIAAMADAADADTLVVSLISGGGSAILPSPLEYETQGRVRQLALADKQETTRALLACGADIREINCVRKHLSGLKGGRLLNRIAPARSINLILSDVVGDDLSSIASGMTTHDPTTYADAMGVLDRYGIADQVPASVMTILRRGMAGDLPESLKPEGLDRMVVTNLLIGTNRSALRAAGEKAQELGFTLRLVTSRVTGEAREVAKFLAGVAMDIRTDGLLATRPACIICGGEPVVTLRGAGKGGRNQEMALAFLAEIEAEPQSWDGIYFLAASTDGNDGPTDAAGAFADRNLFETARKQGLGIGDYLAANDAYTFFDAVGGLLKTGPTNTNVCDLQILLVP